MLLKRVVDHGITIYSFCVKDNVEVCVAIFGSAGVVPAQTFCIDDDIMDLSTFTLCDTSYAVTATPDYEKKPGFRSDCVRWWSGCLMQVGRWHFRCLR